MSRAATSEDVDVVAECLASAFFDDPLWGHWTFPDEHTRARDLVSFMRFWAATAIRDPWVRMTDGCESVAVWHPPGEPELTPEQEAELEPLLDEWFGARARDLRALFDQFDAFHPKGDPHFYLSWWATHADHAGQGFGARLIRENLVEIDAQALPAYLESTNPVNLPRYEALGFVPLSRFGPPGGPVITTMWREAASGPRSTQPRLDVHAGS